MMLCASLKHARRFKLQQHAGMVARDLDLALALIAHLALVAVVVGLLGVDRRGIAPPHQVAALAAHASISISLSVIAGDELVTPS